eukprot:4056353-Prymnesium_polylepis.1
MAGAAFEESFRGPPIPSGPPLAQPQRAWLDELLQRPPPFKANEPKANEAANSRPGSGSTSCSAQGGGGYEGTRPESSCSNHSNDTAATASSFRGSAEARRPPR